MRTTYFASGPRGDVVEIELLSPYGRTCRKRMLVDSGFTGEGSFILPFDALEMIHTRLQSGLASGALRGWQERATVLCRIAALNVERLMAAVITDTSELGLPGGIDGMVGLTFLRQFDRWGGERTGDGSWRFFLAVRGK